MELLEFPRNRDRQKRKEIADMARKSRYTGYMKGLQKFINRKGKVSTRESVLSRLKSLKDKEFHMTIPIGEGAGDAQ